MNGKESSEKGRQLHHLADSHHRQAHQAFMSPSAHLQYGGDNSLPTVLRGSNEVKSWVDARASPEFIFYLNNYHCYY